MTGREFVSVLIVLFVLLSGCIGQNDSRDKSDGYGTHKKEQELITSPATPVMKEKQVEQDVEILMINNISLDLKSYNDRGWSDLYQQDELDCSRMSTYFWDYVRTQYRVAPKIIVSYERQHAWIALRVKDAGNSSDFKHWNIKGVDYYFLEATVPKIVADDSTGFIINGRKYTSSEFYNATIYVFDTPQDANDFHADYTYRGGWNQEFRLRSDDLAKISKLLI